MDHHTTKDICPHCPNTQSGLRGFLYYFAMQNKLADADSNIPCTLCGKQLMPPKEYNQTAVLSIYWAVSAISCLTIAYCLQRKTEAMLWPVAVTLLLWLIAHRAITSYVFLHFPWQEKKIQRKKELIDPRAAFVQISILGALAVMLPLHTAYLLLIPIIAFLLRSIFAKSRKHMIICLVLLLFMLLVLWRSYGSGGSIANLLEYISLLALSLSILLWHHLWK